MMEKGKEPAAANEDGEVGKTESEEIQEALEIVLFQVSECYVYLVSPPFPLFTLYASYESLDLLHVNFEFLLFFLGSHSIRSILAEFYLVW